MPVQVLRSRERLPTAWLNAGKLLPKPISGIRRYCE
jgi:hypothetical protein